MPLTSGNTFPSISRYWSWDPFIWCLLTPKYFYGCKVRSVIEFVRIAYVKKLLVLMFYRTIVKQTNNSLSSLYWPSFQSPHWLWTHLLIFSTFVSLNRGTLVNLNRGMVQTWYKIREGFLGWNNALTTSSCILHLTPSNIEFSLLKNIVSIGSWELDDFWFLNLRLIVKNFRLILVYCNLISRLLDEFLNFYLY